MSRKDIGVLTRLMEGIKITAGGELSKSEQHLRTFRILAEGIKERIITSFGKEILKMAIMDEQELTNHINRNRLLPRYNQPVDEESKQVEESVIKRVEEAERNVIRFLRQRFELAELDQLESSKTLEDLYCEFKDTVEVFPLVPVTAKIFSGKSA